VRSQEAVADAVSNPAQCAFGPRAYGISITPSSAIARGQSFPVMQRYFRSIRRGNRRGRDDERVAESTTTERTSSRARTLSGSRSQRARAVGRTRGEPRTLPLSPPWARRRVIDSARLHFESLCRHDEEFYAHNESLYNCHYHKEWRSWLMTENTTPTESNPISIAVVPCIQLNPSIEYEQLDRMDRNCERLRSPPVLSLSVIKKFLARAHAFTALGLEVQATAYSVEPDGVISLLAFLPQVNEVTTVYAREIMDDAESRTLPTELDAFDLFRSLVPPNSQGFYASRCWIHTHPRPKAFMSSVDLVQLYNLMLFNPDSFGIVISPRQEGIKMLCVHLTEEGKNQIATFYSEARRMNVAAVSTWKIALLLLDLGSSFIGKFLSGFRMTSVWWLICELKMKSLVNYVVSLHRVKLTRAGSQTDRARLFFLPTSLPTKYYIMLN